MAEAVEDTDFKANDFPAIEHGSGRDRHSFAPKTWQPFECQSLIYEPDKLESTTDKGRHCVCRR